MTPKEVIQLAKDKGVKIVDFKLCDIPGTWQHFAVPAEELHWSLSLSGASPESSRNSRERCAWSAYPQRAAMLAHSPRRPCAPS